MFAFYNLKKCKLLKIDLEDVKENSKDKCRYLPINKSNNNKNENFDIFDR